jgi:nucleoside-diphosphate-sugar epimerase
MRILVTGGAGFIGRHLCEALLKLDHYVDALDSLVTSHIENITPLQRYGEQFKFFHRDVCASSLPFQDYDAIVHLASPASPIRYLAHPLTTMLANSIGTYRVLDYAQRHRCIALIASTSEVYGDPDRSPQAESYIGRINTLSPRSIYNESKRFAESLAMLYHREYGVDVRIVRIFNTYGPGMQIDDGRIVPSFIKCIRNKKPFTIFGDGLQTRSLCYIDDLVIGLIAMLTAKKEFVSGEVVNLGMPREHTVLEIAQHIACIMNIEPTYEYHQLPQDDPLQRCPDIAKARTLLGWEPLIMLEEGLLRTLTTEE